MFERPDAPIRLALLDAGGQVLREAVAVDGTLSLDTRGIERGTYVLRASMDGGADGHAPVRLRVLPPLR